MTIDGHVHLHLRGNPLVKNRVLTPEWEAPVERFVSLMDTFGVDKAVIVPVTPHPLNDRYVSDAAAKYPGRFAIVGVHDAQAVDPAADYALRAEAFGLQGLRLSDLGDLNHYPIEEHRMFPLLSELEHRGHCLWLFGQANQFPLLRRFLDRLPDLKVGLNQMGYPNIESRPDEHGRPDRSEAGIPPTTLPEVLDLASYKNVYVMLGGMFQVSREPHPHTDVGNVIRSLWESYGADRCFWATDWPWVDRVPGYGEMPEIIDANLPGLSPAERRAVFGGTCERLFQFN